MNQVFNPVFAFNRILGNEGANRVSSGLYCHPILWELFSFEEFFNSAASLFGTDLENWTPKNIISNVDNLIDLSNTAAKFDQNKNYLDVCKETNDVSESIQEITEKRKNNESWEDILQDLNWYVIKRHEVYRKWGTVFSICSAEQNERIQLEETLIKKSDLEYILLASLFNLYQDQMWVSEFLTRNIDFFITNPKNIKKLVFNLEKIGGKNVAYRLVDGFLNNSKFTKEINDCKNSCPLPENPFEKIERLNEFRFLSYFIKDTEKTELIESITKNLQDKSLIKKPVKLYDQELDLDLEDLLSLEKYFSISSKNLPIILNNHSVILQEIFLAFETTASDTSAVRDICKRFLVEVKKVGINNVIFSPQYGYQIDPIDIAKLLINTGLEYEAILLLEKVNCSQSNNLSIIRFLAHYANLFGDHNRAVKYFSKITVIGNISREEKILFCKSLQYLGMWQDVLLVRNSINALNVNDELELAIAAHKARNKNELKDHIERLFLEFPKDKIAKAIDLLFLQDFQENKDFDDQLKALFKEPNKDIRTIGFIEEYLREKGKFDQIVHFLNDLPGKYKHHPEIQLLKYKAHLKVGDINSCNSILNDLSRSEAIIHQEVLEEIIHELLEKNLFNEAKNLLDIYREKWKLSPTIIIANSMIILEEKDYLGAKDRISLLLEDNVVNEDTISVFGCCLLETSLSDFPYRKSIKKLSVDKKEKFQEFNDQLSSQKSNVLINLLNVEICEDDKENKYIELLTNSTSLKSKDNWRVPFGLGCIYFGKKKFDQAIIYLKEALKIVPTHKVIFDLLIHAYGHLKLPGEAIKLIEFQSERTNLSLTDLIKYSEFLFEYDEFIIFLEKKEAEGFSNPVFSIALARVFIKNGNYKTAEFQLSKIESEKNLSEGYMLAIAQCYLDCTDEFSSRRVLEKYLSMKNVIDTDSILESVSIYYQLGEYDKSFNLLKSVKGSPVLKSLIEADILVKLNKIELAANTIEDLLLTEEINVSFKEKFLSIAIKIPENWILDLPRIYLLAIGLQLRLKNYKKANELAEKGAICFPSREDFQELVLKISYLIVATNLNYDNLGNYLGENSFLNNNLALIIAETALDNEQEIIAAKIISDVSSGDINLHLASIRARLLSRNGQEQEANDIYQIILAKNFATDLPIELCSSDDLSKLISYLALCETAFRLGDLSNALEISKRIHLNLGLIPRNMEVYLKILTKMLERNKLFEKLMVKNNIFRVSDDDLDLLNMILEKDDPEMLQNQDWKIRARSVVDGDIKSLEKVVELGPTHENISAIIFSFLKLGRKTEAEKVLNLVDKNEEARFVYALLEIDENPEKALSIMLKILQNGNPCPEYYAVLSKAYENLGMYSDSYSAISLAINIWPDEYEWENIAGRLCKKLGNNLAAVSHLRKAESYNVNRAYSHQLNDNSMVNFLTNRNDLEKILTNTAKDIPLLLEIINTLIEEDRDDEIDHFLNKLRNYKLNSTEISIIEAKVAFKNKKIEESIRIINSVLQNDPFDLETLKLKAKIIVEQEDMKRAIIFLDSIDKDKVINPTDLIILKAQYLEKTTGIESAISYLTNELKNEKDNIDVIIFTAQLIFMNGNPTNSLRLAEDALNTNADNSELLSLLSNISKDLGDLDKAIDYMIKSISIDPFQGQKYILLSTMFEARRDYKRAIDILYEGLDVLPDDYPLLRYTGLLFYKQGNYKEAHSVLEKAVRINSLDSDLKQIIRILENSLYIKMNLDIKN